MVDLVALSARLSDVCWDHGLVFLPMAWEHFGVLNF